MTKELCPKDCGLIDVDSPVCKNVCWHKDDEVVKPRKVKIGERIKTMIGRNKDEIYLDDHTSVHESSIK